MSVDYYEMLGVARNATDDEIKRAYRALARQYHPDSNPDPQAAEQFKDINVAYETLKDPERRRRYDLFGDDGARAGGGPGPGGPGGEAFGFGDIFDAFFGGDPFGNRQAGPPRAPDAEAVHEDDEPRPARPAELRQHRGRPTVVAQRDELLD